MNSTPVFSDYFFKLLTKFFQLNNVTSAVLVGESVPVPLPSVMEFNFIPMIVDTDLTEADCIILNGVTDKLSSDELSKLIVKTRKYRYALWVSDMQSNLPFGVGDDNAGYFKMCSTLFVQCAQPGLSKAVLLADYNSKKDGENREFIDRFLEDCRDYPLSEMHQEEKPLAHPYTINKVISGVPFKFLIGNLNGKNWYDLSTRAFPGSDVQCENWTELQFIKDHLLAPGDVIFDVGAHQGFYTMCFAKWAGSVITFEKRACHHHILCKNVELNKLSNVKPLLCEVGFGDDREGFLLELDNVTTAPNFIKIDVDGDEVNVLRGAKKYLQTLPNLAIQVNYAPMIEGGDSVADFIACVDWSKYNCWYVHEGMFKPWDVSTGINCQTSIYAQRR